MANDKNNKDLFKMTQESLISTDLVGTVQKIDTPTLKAEILKLFQNSLGLTSLTEVFMKPIQDRHSQAYTNVACYLCFKLGSDIYRPGRRDNNTPKNRSDGPVDLMDYTRNADRFRGRKFQMSENAQSVLYPLADSLDNNGKISFRTPEKQPGIVLLRVDFFALMALALSVKSDDSLNFSLLDCYEIGRDSGEFQMLFMKYIDSGSVRRARRENIDYEAIENEIFSEYNGGGNRRR